MKLLILSLTVAIASGSFIRLPGQCLTEAELALDHVNFKTETVVDDYYTILTTNHGPNYGVQAKRSATLNPDGSIAIREYWKTLSDKETNIFFNATRLPNSKKFRVTRQVEGEATINTYEGYVIYNDEKGDVSSAYICRNLDASNQEVELFVWSRKRTNVDLYVYNAISEFIPANNLQNVYDFLQIIQQPCCSIDTKLCG